MQQSDFNKRIDYIINNINGVSWEFDLEKDRFTYVSQNTQKITSYPPEEWTDFASWVEMLHPEDKERAANYCVNETKKKKDHFFEYRIVKKNGEVIWVLDIISLGYDENGNPNTLIGTIIDITEKKELELQSQKERDYLQNILDSLADPTMIINEDYTIEFANKAAKNHLNCNHSSNRSDLKCYEISHQRDTPCDLSGEECPLKAVLESKQSTTVIHEHFTNGQKQIVELHASPIINKEGRVTGIIESARDISHHLNKIETLQQETIQLDYQATHDPLTQLPNRNYFHKKLQELIQNHNGKNKIIVGYIDLDKFKPINDTYGHNVGDLVLQECAKRLRNVTRESDIISRVGGDEFTLIIPNATDTNIAVTVAKKIITTIKKPIKIDDSLHVTLSCSIGFSIYPDNASDGDIEKLIIHADTAMYNSKQSDTQKYNFF